MANEKNLIPLNKRTKEEQREIARKGGIKSGEVRRKRKTFREDFLAALETEDFQNKITASIMNRASKGDLEAFKTIADFIGETPTKKVEVGGEGTFNVNITVKKPKKEKKGK